MSYAIQPVGIFAHRFPQTSRFSVRGKVVFTFCELNTPDVFGALAAMGEPFMHTYDVRAHWDPESGVWWAESDDVPGLIAEAATHDGLVAELKQLVPELLALNMPEVLGQPATLRIISEQSEDLCAA